MFNLPSRHLEQLMEHELDAGAKVSVCRLKDGTTAITLTREGVEVHIELREKKRDKTRAPD